MTLFVHDRSARLRMTFTGAQAKAALGGLVTNDVVALTTGEGQRAAALTAKGRVIALCRVFDRGSDVLVDCDAAAGDGLSTMIRKYVNPRLATFAVVTGTTDCLGVHGDGASAAIGAAIGAAITAASGADDVDRATSASLDALAPLGGLWLGSGDDAVWVVCSDDLSVPGFDLIASRARIGDLRAALTGAGARTASAEEIRTLRVERGLPEWGAEMDAETIPQEAVLDDLGAISFSKGCYTGQEVVARIHFRGHVNRHLRWLVSEAPMRAGARVIDAAGAEVGVVRTAVISASRGPLAIAMVRREVEPGTTITVQDADGSARARVERMSAERPRASSVADSHATTPAST